MLTWSPASDDEFAFYELITHGLLQAIRDNHSIQINLHARNEMWSYNAVTHKLYKSVWINGIGQIYQLAQFISSCYSLWDAALNDLPMCDQQILRDIYQKVLTNQQMEDQHMQGNVDTISTINSAIENLRTQLKNEMTSYFDYTITTKELELQKTIDQLNVDVFVQQVEIEKLKAAVDKTYELT
jgi:hypothetical protein